MSALIGQGACRLLACSRAAIDSTRAGASGSLQATGTPAPRKALSVVQNVATFYLMFKLLLLIYVLQPC